MHNWQNPDGHAGTLVTPKKGDSQCTVEGASFGFADATSCEIREKDALDCFRLYSSGTAWQHISNHKGLRH
jgi:hypothetical protein